MEKWTRQLSRTMALILGLLAVIGVYLIYHYAFGQATGYLYLIVWCALMGALVGFAAVMLSKALTGMTPQERGEMKKK